jgi:6-phosphofructokinase 2
MNPTVDKNAVVEHVVAERKLRCRPPRHDPGGGGINVSRAIQRLGGRSLALYPAGGAIGTMLQNLLGREEIEYCVVPIEGMTRENLTIREGSTDQQYRFGMPGPFLRETEWEQCLDELSNVDPHPEYIVASGSLPPGAPNDFYSRVARLGHELSSQVILDTSGEALLEAVQEGVYLVKPNMRELRQLAGEELRGEAEQESAAKEIVRQGRASAVIVSLGAAGALFVSAKATKRIRAPTVQIRSKIGAGDSMVAGIALGLARGKALHDAVLFGIAAGSAAVMTPGTELCRRQDTERLYEQMRSADA